jgi:hypothetical protein
MKQDRAGRWALTCEKVFCSYGSITKLAADGVEADADGASFALGFSVYNHAVGLPRGACGSSARVWDAGGHVVIGYHADISVSAVLQVTQGNALWLIALVNHAAEPNLAEQVARDRAIYGIHDGRPPRRPGEWRRGQLIRADCDRETGKSNACRVANLGTLHDSHVEQRLL